MARLRTALAFLALPMMAALGGAGCAGNTNTAAVQPAPPEPEVVPISADALSAIDHAFAVTYQTEFEHCFEDEMERTERDQLEAQFSIEADIDTEGRITDTRLVRAHAPGADDELHALFHGPSGIAERFHGCVEAKLEDWEIPHPPEAPYTHTLGLSLGEAW